MLKVESAVRRGFGAFLSLIGALETTGGGVFHSSSDTLEEVFDPPEDPIVLALMDPHSESGLRRD